MGLRILVAGSGGREHALCWKLAQSPKLDALFCAPGNPGTAEIAQNVPIRSRDVEALSAAALRERIDLVVIGPEEPLAAGLTEALTAAGVAVFGPTQAAARIETSKSWAKEVMRAGGIPMPRSIVVDDLVAALTELDQFGLPVAIKADGPAGGKGSVIARDREEAEIVLTAMLENGALGAAGRRVVIEEYVKGAEYAIYAVTDGERFRLLPPARVYKQLLAGGAGPNTPGMGALVAPKPIDSTTLAAIERGIIQPALVELANRGAPFRGVLGAEVMITPRGPVMLEFNARFSDPDAQALLPLLEIDLAELCLAAASGSIDDAPTIPTSWESSVAVMLASGGYPGPTKSGLPIEGLDQSPDGALLFHGATRRNESGRLLTGGGRVATVVGRDLNPEFARTRAYAAAGAISFDGMQFRRDIGR
jgi:phosphoribosylamine--glycine ligase